MSEEIKTLSVEKSDIEAPLIEAGGTAIVLQRHERYERDKASAAAGSIFGEDAAGASERDLDFFNSVLGAENETDRESVFVLFVSSPTQYNGLGRRSLETTQLAQDAAIQAFEAHGIDPATHVINLNSAATTHDFRETGQVIRPVKSLREPDIFDSPGYVDFLRDKYGKEDGPGNGISKAAWGAHESDLEAEERVKHGAEGVDEVVERTEHSIELLARYARWFHQANPGSRLVIWAGTHYDTISPLVKKLTGTSRDEYIPVDYGAGIVIDIDPNGAAHTKVGDTEIEVPLKTAARLRVSNP